MADKGRGEYERLVALARERTAPIDQGLACSMLAVANRLDSVREQLEIGNDIAANRAYGQ